MYIDDVKFIFFHIHVVETLAKLWRKTPIKNDIPNRVFTIPQQTSDEESTFRKKYDETQQKLESIAAMDDLLSGIILAWGSTMYVPIFSSCFHLFAF